MSVSEVGACACAETSCSEREQATTLSSNGAAIQWCRQNRLPPTNPNTLVDRCQCAQRPEKLPHVLYHRAGLFPEGKMASLVQLREAHQVEISLHQTPGRFEVQRLTRINDASWSADSAGEDWVVVEA